MTANTQHAATLSAQAVDLSYGGPTIVHGLTTNIPSGEITVIVGANGCEKSTLLRALARLLKPTMGSVLLDGNDIHSLSTKKVAARLGLPGRPTGFLFATSCAGAVTRTNDSLTSGPMMMRRP
jgi:iron complex transport system ATP-binding protein